MPGQWPCAGLGVQRHLRDIPEAKETSLRITIRVKGLSRRRRARGSISTGSRAQRAWCGAQQTVSICVGRGPACQTKAQRYGIGWYASNILKRDSLLGCATCLEHPCACPRRPFQAVRFRVQALSILMSPEKCHGAQPRVNDVAMRDVYGVGVVRDGGSGQPSATWLPLLPSGMPRGRRRARHDQPRQHAVLSSSRTNNKNPR